MGYEKEVLVRARARYQENVDRMQQVQQERRNRIYREYPRVREIDQQLRQTMAELMAETFRNGEDPREAVELLHRKNLALQQERRGILRRSGYGESYLTDGPTCRRCSDTGYVGEKMCSCLERFCQEEQKKTLTSLLSGRLSSFDDFSLDYYTTVPDGKLGISPRKQMEIIYDTCVEYATKFSLRSPSLLMNGGTGLGKTFLSACIARQVVSLGYSVVYDTAIHVFNCLEKEKFGNAGEEEKKSNLRIVDCDLLILDDLGTEMTTAFIPSALYTVVNGRLMAGKPTIISTNLSQEELCRRYGQQIASRLLGEYMLLVFMGQDIRIQKTQV